MSGYRKEWPCCGDETYTEAWEPERCPFCELNDAKDRIAELETELEAAQAPASGEVEPVVYWVLYDSAADKKYIKKSLGDGSLAFFDTEAEARRAKTRHGKNVGYKRVEYYTHPPEKVPEDVQEIIEQRDVFKAQAAEYQKAYEALLTTPTPATTPETELPKGWKLVPIEPTESMMRDAADNLCGEFGVEYVRPKEQFARAVYRQLVGLAPAPPQEQ